ncbi:unnamed protein product [Schistocephalus solidus]|uniref:Uncharacterized protein n=1 Tax=Schistocephalus solidus TaxID=70667 RepID=A0A183SPR6_SCHSO|nr:unnamed protein product [Schistocephalus solidus]
MAEVNLLTVTCLALLLLCLILLGALLCRRLKPRVLCPRRRRQQFAFPADAWPPLPPSQPASPPPDRPRCFLPEMSPLASVPHDGEQHYGRRESPVGSSETEAGFFTDSDSTTNQFSKFKEHGSTSSSARAPGSSFKIARRSITSFVATLFDAGNSLAPTDVRYKKRLKQHYVSAMDYFRTNED